MWSAQDVAQHQVRRQANGLDMAAVAEKVAEAAARERKTAEQLRRGGSFSEFQTDPERLAAIWAAKQVEWRRVRDLMSQAGWGVYEPERDTEGSTWAREREERCEGALAARVAFESRRREKADEVRAELWLSAAPSRLIREVADRAGLVPAQVLAQLAERVVVGEDGTVSVPPFTPSR
ncbi:hypothetical protein [Streptomyces albogriseolus]|uniref:hypothetical protein n=1 Tax=Streptomyces albogriseolus TaxID=1887 RepID=UPI00224EA6D2|nr:hypothetical protein [Streptomyces viridodiastaticus]MCX4564744.1 hypothetical protein [Streptomyces viridodiastaticus]MCX4571304.1 hypothetical protein [Streptomyces viridodiastaticus]MCX4571509.1 hypothetical protein [Streptomyces viridodiastaticus]